MTTPEERARIVRSYEQGIGLFTGILVIGIVVVAISAPLVFKLTPPSGALFGATLAVGALCVAVGIRERARLRRSLAKQQAGWAALPGQSAPPDDSRRLVGESVSGGRQVRTDRLFTQMIWIGFFCAVAAIAGWLWLPRNTGASGALLGLVIAGAVCVAVGMIERRRLRHGDSRPLDDTD